MNLSSGHYFHRSQLLYKRAIQARVKSSFYDVMSI